MIMLRQALGLGVSLLICFGAAGLGSLFDQALDQRMVRCATQTAVDPTQLAIRTGLVGALSRDGDCCPVGVAQCWGFGLETRAHAPCPSACS